MKTLSIDPEDREVEISFDGERIVIEKPVDPKDFASNKIKEGHQVRQLNYYNGNEICTCIYADFTDKSLRIKNADQPNVLLAFGSNSLPTWEDFMAFLEERCVPRSRDGIGYYLNELGLDKYDPMEIVIRTEGRMAEDKQWLEVVDLK